MSERPSPSLPPFEQTYNELCDLAAGATKGGMWFHIQDGEDSRPPAVRIYEYSHPTTPAYSLRGGQRKPPQTRTHYYKTWDHGIPNEVTQVSREMSRGTPDRPPYNPRFNELTVVQLSNAFIDRAVSAEELDHVTKNALQQSANQLPLTGTEANSLTARIVFKAIALQENGSKREPISYFDGLTRGHRSYEKFRDALGTSLGMILAWQPGTKGILSGIPYYARELDRAYIADALVSFDDAGLLGQTFWQRYALRASVTSPETHPHLRTKLYAGELPDLLRVDSLVAKAKKESAITDHMTRVLNRHAGDPTRHQANVYKMLGHVLANGTVNIEQTIHFSNLVMETIRGESPDNVLNPRISSNILQAFARCLWITRRMDAPPSVRTEQLEQDILQNELLAVLQSDHPQRRVERTLATIALQYPRASPDQILQARARLQQNYPIADVVKSLS